MISRNVVAAVIGAFAVVTAAPLAGATAQDTSREEQKPSVDPHWLQRLDRNDRAFLDENIGFALPAFTDDLKWIGNDAPESWNDFHGKVVVLQTWTSRSAAASTWPERAQRAVEGMADRGAVVIALHTPDGAEKAETWLENHPQTAKVVIDPSGAFCDAIGAYRSPVNLVIDRAGAVRYAGLNEEGLKAAVAELVEESVNSLQPPQERPAIDAAPADADFPPVSGSVSSAMDIRGKRAPEFYVQEWLTKQPKVSGKVVIIDFWATWCGPCVSAIPHMSEIADEFKDDVAVIGISSESKNDCVKGIEAKGLRQRIRYSIAVDPSNRMAGAIKITGIPHVIVLSSDWVVRWQGHPGAGLTREVVKQIVDANKSAAPNPRMRWTAKANMKRPSSRRN